MTATKVTAKVTGPVVTQDVGDLPKYDADRWGKLLTAVRDAETGERSEADQRLVTFAVSKSLDRDEVWSAVSEYSKFGERGEDYFSTCWRNAEKWDAREYAEAVEIGSRYELEEETPDVPPDRDDITVVDVPGIDEVPAPTTVPAVRGDRRDFQDANELLNYPDPDFLIEGIMEEKSFGMLYGLPGCLKTFLALDMALSLAHGLPFLGKFNVPKEVPIAYITPEGTAGLKRRLKSWMESNGVDQLRNTYVNRHAFRLNDEAEAEAVITKVAAAKIKPKVVFIDTLARNFSGDENSTKDMSLFVNNVMEISDRLGLAVVVVHHSGKDTAKGARGSIALLGAVDLAIEMVKPNRDDLTATVRCQKQKDSEEFPAFNVTGTKVGPSLSLAYGGTAKAAIDAASEQVTTEEIRPVLAVLPVAGGAKVGDIVTATSKPDATVRRHLDLAVRHGYADKVEGRPLRYVRTEKGTQTVVGNA